MYKKALAGFLAFIIVFSDVVCNVSAKDYSGINPRVDSDEHTYTFYEQEATEAKVQPFENLQDIEQGEVTESDITQDETIVQDGPITDENTEIEDGNENTEIEDDNENTEIEEGDESTETEGDGETIESGKDEEAEKTEGDDESADKEEDKDAEGTEENDENRVNIEDDNSQKQEMTGTEIGIQTLAENDFNYTVLNGSYIKLTSYSGTEVEVVIPESIDGYAVQAMENVFKNNKTVEVVTLPESLEILGGSNFYNCTKLKRVVFNSDITSIGNSCFYGCSGFQGTLSIPESVTEIGASAYANCAGVIDVAFPVGLRTVGNNAFMGCTGLTGVELPDSVESMGNDVFKGCSNLTTVNYPISWSKASSWGGILSGTRVEEIEIPEGVTKLPEYAFKDCPTIKRVVLPSTLTEISGSAFYGCTGITGRVTIPQNVTNIEGSAFYGCTGLTGIDQPEGLKSIGPSAFYGCTGLTGVELPDSVESMGNDVFKGCSNLTTVNYPISWSKASSWGGILSGTRVEEIEIPEGVTKLPEYAFKDCPTIKRVVLPSTLTEISGSAFYGCTGITGRVTIPQNVTNIEGSAFYGCTGLTGIDQPEGLKSIGPSAFYGCTGLTGVELPDSVESMGNDVFKGCSNLTTINYPMSWSKASSWGGILSGTRVRTITVPEGVTVIPQYAFKDCSNLVTVNLPGSLTVVSAYAFSGCTELERIATLESVVSIGNNAFLNCQSLKEAVLKNCTGIGADAFSGCGNMEKIWINPEVTSIGSGAFKNCGSLVIHGEAGSYAETYANANNIEFSTDAFDAETLSTVRGKVCVKGTGSGIKDVTISVFDMVTGKDAGTYVSDVDGEYSFEAVVGHKIKVIYYHMQYKFDNPSVIYIVEADANELADNHAVKTVDGYTDEADFTTSAIDSLNVNITGYVGSDTIVVIPRTIKGSTVKSIAGNCFKGKTGITKVVLASGITSIGASAFSGCTGLAEVTMPYGLRTVGNNAFMGCTSLTEVELPDSVNSMGAGVFKNCSNLTTVNYPLSWSEAGVSGGFLSGTKVKTIAVPEGVKEIPGNAFRDCSGLEAVSFSSTLMGIGSHAFNGCTGLAGISVPEGTAEIGRGAFTGCTGLSVVSLPEGLKSIEDNAFMGCTGLTKVELPDSVSSMGAGVFKNCSNLMEMNYPRSWSEAGLNGELLRGTKVKEITVPEGVAVIPQYAFRDSDSLERVSLPATLTGISVGVFNGCTGLKEITVPEGAERIGRNAFNGCTGLRGVNLPKGLKCIEENAFMGCTGLTEVELPDSVSSMGAGVFKNCSNLTKVNYPLSWSEAGLSGELLKGTKVRTITVPEGVEELPQYAFRDCSNLVTVNLPGSLTVIPAYAFSGCTELERIATLESVVSIGNNAFLNCQSLKEAVLKNCTGIGADAFSGCGNMEKIWINPEVTSIGSGAFKNCGSLVIHGEAGSYAETYANANNIEFSTDAFDAETLSTVRGKVCVKGTGSGIKDVTISVFDMVTGKDAGTYVSDVDGEYSFEAVVGHKIKVIYYHMQYKFDNPSVIYIVEADANELADNHAVKTVDGYTDEADFTTSAIDSLNVNITGYVGSDTIVVIPRTIKGSTVKSIAGNCFKGKTGITKVVLASGITSIGASAFSGCTGLAEVTMPYGLRTVGNNAFMGCTSLTEVELPDSVNSMGAGVFKNCSNLTTVNYPLSWSEAGVSGGFLSGTKVKTIAVPEGVKEIPGNAFRDCSGLEAVSFSSTLMGIGSHAFNGCTGLAGISVPEGTAEIGRGAFTGCTGLSVVSLPEGLKSIEDNAFMGCTGLTKVELPDSVSSMGAGVFKNCSNLMEMNYPRSWSEAGLNGELLRGTKVKEITVPEGVAVIPQYAFRDSDSLERVSLPATLTGISVGVFNGCTGLKEITVPEGAERIGRNAFNGCTGLRGVNLPKGLKCIEENAFMGCTGLTEVELPDSVSSMGAGVFKNCSNLTKVNYPLSWSEAGLSGELLKGTKVRTITVPEGVEELPQYAFRDCSNLVTVNLPGSLTTISANAFENCTGIINFIFPEKLKEVGNYAFSGCANLKSVSMTESVSYISSSAFSNCGKLTIYCPMYSYAAIFAMDNGISTNFTQDFPYDMESAGLDYGKSSYYLDVLKLSASGTIDFTLDYRMKEDSYVEMSDMIVSIHVPDDAELVNKSLRKDGVIITDFENADNTLRFRISDQSGKIHFSLKPENQVHVKSYASISYSVNGEEHQDVVGIIDAMLPVLTLNMDKTTNSGSVQLSGIAPSQAEVSISIGDEVVSSVHASRAGKYSADINVPTDKKYATHTVTARCVDSSGNVLTASADVTYNADYPAISKFVMQYNGKTYDLLDINNKNPIITFVPSKSMTFEVEFDNTENVEEVYVVSDRNNVKKYLKAEYDEKTNRFLTSGGFDPQNRNYVPGTITVEYSRKKKQVPIDSNYDFVNEIINPALSDKVIGSTSSTTTEGNTTTTTVKFGGDVGELVSEEIKLVITTTDSEYGADLSGILKSYEGFYAYLFEEDGKKYVLNLDYTNPKTYVTIIHDISSNKMIKYAISALETPSNSVAISDVLDKLGTAKHVTGTILDMLEINEDDEELRDKISASDLSPEEKQEALKKAEELKKDRQNFLALSTIISVAVMGFTGPSAVVFGLLFGAITTASSFFWDARMAGILEGGSGVSASWRWKVDPSGTVYEAVPTNPLPGATVTAYYKDADTGERILWNADEWDQTNPLITDAVGFYAWDVPEGLWQVTFEKDGYESQESKWLEVAPPQTDVNASLVSMVSPVIESCVIGDSFAEVTFSKYMRPETVKALVLKDGNGKRIPYILVYDTSEVSDAGEILARTYYLVYENYVALPDSEYSIITDERILSYSGAEAVANVYTQEAKAWNVVIEGNKNNEIKDNESLKLTAKYKDTGEELNNCIWSIRDSDQIYASISEEGMVTAKTITDGKSHYIVVSVKTAADGEVEAMYKLNIVPAGIDDGNGVLAEDVPEDGVIPDGIWIAGIDKNGYAYSRKAIKPEFRVYDGSRRLKLKTDYTISYKNNTKAYTISEGEEGFDAKKAPAVIVTGKGNYSSREYVYFKIIPKDIMDEDVTTAEIPPVLPTNKKQNPALTLTWEKKKLVNKTDYTVTCYSDESCTVIAEPKESGTYYVKISGKGNYTGDRKMSFVIAGSTQKLVRKLSVGKIKNKIYTGLPVELTADELVVKDGKTILTAGKEYTITYSDNHTDIGTVTVTIIGDGETYVGSKTVTFKITGTALGKAKMTGFVSSLPYAYGNAVTQNVVFTYNGNLLTGIKASEYEELSEDDSKRDYDYIWEYTDNVNPGKVTVIYTGVNKYTGIVKKNYTITGVALSKAKLENLTGTFTYDGEDKTQDELKLKYNGTEIRGILKSEYENLSSKQQLEYGYTIEYQNNIKAGKAKVILRGINVYTGTVTKTYTIAPFDISKDTSDQFKIATDGNVIYYSKAGAKPQPIVTFKGTLLTMGTDYTVSWSNNTNINDGTGGRKVPLITVKGKGNFKGIDKTMTFAIAQRVISDGSVRVTAPDKVYSTKKNAWKSSVTVVDTDGQKLSAGKDYERAVVYTYKESGNVVADNDIVPANTTIVVTVTGKDKYKGTVTGEYRVVSKNIGKVKASVEPKTYTGKSVTLSDSDIKFMSGKEVLNDVTYIIDESSYKNNIKKGKATVIIKGTGEYGGTKKITYTIGAKGFLWWWRNLSN